MTREQIYHTIKDIVTKTARQASGVQQMLAVLPNMESRFCQLVDEHSAVLTDELIQYGSSIDMEFITERSWGVAQHVQRMLIR